MSPKTALLASMLRQQAGVAEEVPVDVDGLVTSYEILLQEAPVDGFLGLFVPDPPGPGILIKSGQAPGQRRFTIAHELGHFALPTHSRSGNLQCLAKDLHLAGTVSAIEREANEFAAELLMPKAHFGAAIRDLDLTFALVHELAHENRFFVSRTAAAIRLIELTREQCALICAKNGVVEWWIKSENCSFYLERERGSRIPPGSICSAVLAGEEADAQAERVPPGTWFDPRGRDVEVLESTFEIPTLGHVLSLVWMIEEEGWGL